MNVGVLLNSISNLPLLTIRLQSSYFKFYSYLAHTKLLATLAGGSSRESKSVKTALQFFGTIRLYGQQPVGRDGDAHTLRGSRFQANTLESYEAL